MLLLVLGVFRTMPTAEPTRRRHALAVLVFAFFWLGHVSISLTTKASFRLTHFSDGLADSPKS